MKKAKNQFLILKIKNSLRSSSLIFLTNKQLIFLTPFPWGESAGALLNYQFVNEFCLHICNKLIEVFRNIW